MNRYDELTHKSLNEGKISDDDIKWIITDKKAELLPILHAAYNVRYKYFENKVKIHVINNVKNGGCTENCSYCAQSRNTKNKILSYPIKAKDEILADAENSYKGGAYRYCLVFSGSTQNKIDMDYICDVVQEIKKKFPMEVCVSAGFLDPEKTLLLKNAGVDRYNHNLNTSREYYKKICTSHGYKNRLSTIKLAKSHGLDICSGVIIGMGETIEDIISITRDLKSVDVKSVPVNFFIPIEGNRIKREFKLTPEYCLKILSIFRFMLPSSEIRAAGGREYHLRSMQAFSLFPANSLFSGGYLTTGGDELLKTKEMIEDAGFVIESGE